MSNSDLIKFLPEGDVHYYRCADRTWGVAISHPGAVGQIMSLATGMDKSVAAWFVETLKLARGR